MKKLLTLGLVLTLVCTTMSVKSQNAKEMTKEQKISYALGANYGAMVKHDGVTIDANAFVQGLQDAVAGKNQFTDAEMQEIFQMFQEDMQARQNAAANEAKAAGVKFLEENKKNPNVKVTASGLQYTVNQEGKGEHPTATSTVTVHYTGKLIDGTVFDSSVERGEPISFPLNQVIKGWTEGLQLMTPGSKYTFFIPSELGYGEQGAGGMIPGGATLIFDVELIDFK